MDIKTHRQALARALIKSATLLPSNDPSFFNEDTWNAEDDEHKKGVECCIATKYVFVDTMSEQLTTWSNYGPLWMGLWLDAPVYLHDGENEYSRAKSLAGYEAHGYTLFPRWLAEVLKEFDIDYIKDQDIYD